MDTDLFVTLIQNLLHTNAICFDRKTADASEFENRYCYNAALQPMFTAKVLNTTIHSAKERTIYELCDQLGIWTQFFRFEENVYFIGPFTRQEFQPAQARRLLIAHNLLAAYEPSVRLYFSKFPILSSTFVRSTIVACVHALTGTADEYDVCRIDISSGKPHLPELEPREVALDFASVYKRYDLENRFLRMVEAGDVENVLMMYHGMSTEGLLRNRYASTVYQNPSVGISIIRALTRKAAERGGASVIEIDEITQRTVQKLAGMRYWDEQYKCTADMILELTEAVRQAKVRVEGYSVPVKKGVEYIRLNYSQKLTLPDLARHVGISVPYLSKRFKQETGMTVLEYIARLRCELAAEMLETSDTSIQEISNYVGYLDGNYFVKVFKKKYKMTPSQYRAEKRTKKLSKPE